MGDFDENYIKGQVILTVEQVFQLFYRNVPDDELLKMDIVDVCDSISYTTETIDAWMTLLRLCCKLTP